MIGRRRRIHSALSWLGRGGVDSALKARYTDTPITANVTAPKPDPADIVAAIYDGLEAGEHEVLADDTSWQVKQALSAPP